MTAPERTALRHRRFGGAGLVFGLALIVRLVIGVSGPGGLSGNGYDQGVYYTAADALIHGRLPYRDFLLLHPPGLMLVLTPFATLGQITTDHVGFVVANGVFAVLGAVNAALVFRVSRNLALDRGPALAGGLFYAVWSGAVNAETSIRLEPLGTFAFLCGLLVLTRRAAPATRMLVTAGALFGFAGMVKIWWGVPLLVLALWQLQGPGGARRLAALAGGSAAVVIAVFGPFVVAAPGSALRMVVADQVGRHATRTSPIARLEKLTSIHTAVRGLGTSGSLVLLAVVGLLSLALAGAAWQRPAVRPLVVVALAQVAVLLLSPTYFSYYSGYPAAPFALVLAAGVATIAERPATRRVPRLLVQSSAVIAAVVLAVAAIGVGARGRAPDIGPGMAAAAASQHCVMADSPLALIDLDVLSRDLARGCPNWVDVSGRTYDLDASTGATYHPRSRNQRWQADVMRYLMSGNAVVVIRSATGLDPRDRAFIRSLPVLASAGPTTLHAVRR